MKVAVTSADVYRALVTFTVRWPRGSERVRFES
jgi:hypothetical protein